MNAPDITPPPTTNAAAALRVALLAFATFGYMVMWTYMEKNAGRYIEPADERVESHSHIEDRGSEKQPGVIQHLPQHHGESIPDFARLQTAIIDLQRACALQLNTLRRTMADLSRTHGIIIPGRQQPRPTALAILNRIDRHSPPSINVMREMHSIRWSALVTQTCEQIRISMAERLNHDAQGWMRVMTTRWQTALPNLPRISHEVGHEEKQTR